MTNHMITVQQFGIVFFLNVPTILTYSILNNNHFTHKSAVC